MAIEIISRSIFKKVWDMAKIKLVIPGSAVGQVTYCAMQPRAFNLGITTNSYRVPTSSGNNGKPEKSLKKFNAWKNHGI